MLRRDRQIRTQLHQLMDGALFVLSFWLANVLRAQDALSLDVFGYNLLGDASKVFTGDNWVYFIIGFVSLLLLDWQGFYKRSFVGSRRLTIWLLLKACAMTIICLILIFYVTKTIAPRGIMILFGPLAFLLVLAKEELFRLAYKIRFGQPQFRKRMILIGAKDDNTKLRAEIKSKSQAEIEVVAELDLNETSIEELLQILHEYGVNGVLINAKHTFFGQVEKAILACELEGVETWLVADFFKTQISRTSFDDFYGRPILVFHSGPESAWQSLAKQLLDVIGALILFAIFLIPMLAAAVLIKLTSPGPVFFKQKRSGLNGRPFTMYKFRSMETDAEQRKHEIAAMNEMSGPVFKVTNDPRVTPIGRVLRKFSIDECPQLLNVLRGEMSLVGPRPLPVEEVKRFDDLAHRRRLSVRPGLTCLWQVSGRNDVSDFKDWVRLDLEYIDNWSLWLDLKILCRTIPVVLLAKGAK
jgi:exopolysaccharide biosynthesis polyprenyl glycosylphosphotransferase